MGTMVQLNHESAACYPEIAGCPSSGAEAPISCEFPSFDVLIFGFEDKYSHCTSAPTREPPSRLHSVADEGARGRGRKSRMGQVERL
jgi:hypothetical protein